MPRLAFLLLGLLFSPLFLACPPTHVKLPQGSAATLGETLLQSLKTQAATLQTLEGWARMRIIEKGKRRTFRAFFQIKRPSSLYMEIIAAMQQPGVILTADGKDFAIHNLLQKEFLTGPVARLPDVLASSVPADLSPAVSLLLAQLPLPDLVSVFFGQLPLTSAPLRVWSHHEVGLLKLELKNGPQLQTLFLSQSPPAFQKTSVERPSQPPLHLTYEAPSGSPSLPKVIRFQSNSAFEVHLIFLEQKRNSLLKNQTFRQTPPPGTSVRSVASLP